jgi:hypothetical protein
MAYLVYGSTRIQLDPSTDVNILMDQIWKAHTKTFGGPVTVRAGDSQFWMLVTAGVPILIEETIESAGG